MRTPGLLHPRSTGPDGVERLTRAWSLPSHALFREPNNTFIGRLYIRTGFLFFLGAGVLALLMRIQLARPGNAFLGHATPRRLPRVPEVTRLPKEVADVCTDRCAAWASVNNGVAWDSVYGHPSSRFTSTALLQGDRPNR